VSAATFGAEEGAEDRESSQDADVSAGYDSDDQSDSAATLPGGDLGGGLDGEEGSSHEADVNAGYDDEDGTDDSSSPLSR
jgi:hypothetical protein